MLFLTLSTFLLYSVQWISQTIRYQRYARVMQRVLRGASVLVQRAAAARTGYLISTSLLKDAAAVTERTEMEDDFIRLSSLGPVQEVDLSSWTSYLDAPSRCAKPKDVCVMMEARRPRNLDSFAKLEQKVAPAYRVHALAHASPMAWKTAEPFGIILHCSLPNLVILTDAFGQGRLTLDEDLELIGLVTVKTVGCAQNLVSPMGSCLPLADVTGHDEGQGVASKSPKGDVTGGVAGQGQGDEVPSTRARPLQPSDRETTTQLHPVSTSTPEDKLINGASSIASEKETASNGSSKQLEIGKISEMIKQKFSLSASEAQPAPSSSRSGASGNHDDKASRGGSDQPRASSKPPNILVYCGVKDTARRFQQVKLSLEACVNTEAYTIYHLTHESLLADPWRDNAALLVVSFCPQLSSEVEEVVADYIRSAGGNVLSFSSSLDSLFAHREELEKVAGEGLVTLRLDDTSQTVTSVRGCYCYSNLASGSEVLVPYEGGGVTSEEGSSAGSEVVSGPVISLTGLLQKDDDKKEDDDRSGKCAQAVVVKTRSDSGGVVVMSQLLVERDPTEYASDPESFAALKRSNTERLAILTRLLSALDIDTGAGPVPSLTSCYMLAQRLGLRELFQGLYQNRLTTEGVLKSRSLSLKFVNGQDKTLASTSLLPVVTDADSKVDTAFFDMQTYWRHLGTSWMGQIVFYTDVITSTMTVFDGLLFSIPKDVGVIAIAGRQTSGRGRGGNAWLSPTGCAMFTLPVRLDLLSELGQRVSFLQHLVAVAVIRSVLETPGYQHLELKLKWPNDIYYGREMKLGGVLVTSTAMNSVVYATIGCGFNVSNSNPTICLNDIIRQYNMAHPGEPDLEPMTSAQVIAGTMTVLERLLTQFEREGYERFNQLYYSHWLHGGAKVKVKLESESESEGTVEGLDEYGYLLIRTRNGRLISVQPDGNSFDMMQNLVHYKTR
ncbi:biotin--protein ligase [Aplysia californica]|uniref:Biotin--protein ligase n=1 Tax=Aplysia californica TaxID=6500 RepID=A0ABM1ACH5_APLCA|nr:biotin--protein ligase [Aplysia californica]